ncbi:MAG TPA: AbrB family transcriptional regulator [Rhizobiaceae bacterium]|nr:AbrB family transcriptional regulator [Rhizobiaceae bacterium]
METTQPSTPPGRLADKSGALQWGVIVLLSLAFAAIFEVAHLPAALLIGPMLAAIVAGTNGAGVRVPRRAFGAAQAVVGCLIAASLEPEILSAFADGWPLFVAVVLATVAASSLLGYLISRWRILPGTTAVWGSAPGAATAMVLIADAFGADARLVAFMQYLRVIFVSLAAALIARIFVHGSGGEVPAIVWFPPIEWPAFATTIVVATAGGALGYLIRLPSPFFLGAMLFGVALHLGLGLDLQLPEWLLAASYALVGWSIGLNFNRLILRHATRALPQILLSILALMAFCGGLAWLLTRFAGIDPLTAYLATSPGGMDSIAIIAAASQKVNLSFIMALQMARFLFVLLLGPPISRLVAGRLA